jgi:hypothetical protein
VETYACPAPSAGHSRPAPSCARCRRRCPCTTGRWCPRTRSRGATRAAVLRIPRPPPKPDTPCDRMSTCTRPLMTIITCFCGWACSTAALVSVELQPADLATSPPDADEYSGVTCCFGADHGSGAATGWSAEATLNQTGLRGLALSQPCTATKAHCRARVRVHKLGAVPATPVGGGPGAGPRPPALRRWLLPSGDSDSAAGGRSAVIAAAQMHGKGAASGWLLRSSQGRSEGSARVLVCHGVSSRDERERDLEWDEMPRRR